MKRAMFGLMALVLLACVVDAQQNAVPETNAVSGSVQKLVATMSKNIVAGAEEMPSDKYSFRPTPQQNTFAHLVVHMITANYLLCSAISGAEAPKITQPKDEDPKDALKAALKSSFDFCTESLAKLDDSKLEDQVNVGRGTLSRGSIIIIFAQDYGDHYAQEAAYLRAAGLLPPTAQQTVGR